MILKKFQFHSLIFAGLLLATSCTQHQSDNKEDTVKKDTLIKTAAVKKPLNAGTIKPLPNSSCSQIVYQILTSSASYKQLTNGLAERVIKNGGTSFGFMLEGSPSAKIDSAMSYSKTYDYSIHESYPDHDPVIARYTFDPAKRQLFEYNTAQDSLIPIPFNKKLLSELDKACSVK
ncbi:hypothetical protein HDE68_000589 [Pedobacter cryoconitis]|uniref:Lipoprotein n=1 Tax=Pedobacter cryoconitis TaxID=188932 RepID=A0A7W9DY01_9SPHI|nr:hypothetical protein [Pedobacter cryoconitis]MBB5634704.1 hypothetical protein [Pedobacter cryoconitis]